MQRSISLPASSHSPASALALVAVAAGHCVLGLLLYRWRFVPHPTIADSDWLTFAAPVAAGFAGYWLVLRSSRWLRFTDLPSRLAPMVVRYLLLLLLSGIAVFFSFWFYMVIALNTYGS